MKREIIHPASEEDWLKLRKSDITSTMCSALFGLSPYNTVFELYHAKKGNLSLDIEENDRMAKGKRMEEYAANEVCIEHGFTDLRRMDEYIRIPELRMGSSFDFEVVCPERGLGLLEMKAVEYSQYKEKWEDNEAPEHIEVQVQHQGMCAGSKYKWYGIAVFYTLYDHELIIREPDVSMQKSMASAIKKFWHDVDNDKEPDADYYRDGEAIKELYEIHTEELADLTEDDDMDILLSKHVRLKSEEKELTAEIKAVQAEIYERLDGYKGAYTATHKTSITQIKDTPAKTITEDMVGQEYGGRKGQKRLNVKVV